MCSWSPALRKSSTLPASSCALRPTMKLVTKVFNALDASGDQNGYLTIEDLHDAYSASDHPDVKAGKRTEQEVLTDLLEGFEGAGKGGNSKKGDGMVTLDEWIAYYEEVSSSIDTDDYFGVMITKCWSCLKTLAPDGKTLVPAISYVPAYEINTLEKILRKSIYQKAKKGASESRTVEEAFKQFDTDKSGKVSVKEFTKAMEQQNAFKDESVVESGEVNVNIKTYQRKKAVRTDMPGLPEQLDINSVAQLPLEQNVEVNLPTLSLTSFDCENPDFGKVLETRDLSSAPWLAPWPGQQIGRAHV